MFALVFACGVAGVVGVALIASWLAGSLAPPTPAGITPSAAWIPVALPVLRALSMCAGISLIALLLAGLLVRDAEGRRTSVQLCRVTSLVAALWALLLLMLAILTFADVVALPVRTAVDPTALIGFFRHTLPGRIFLVQLLAAMGIALLAQITWRRRAVGAMLGLALIGISASGAGGHTHLTNDHVGATVLLVAHLTAVGLWVGVLLLATVMTMRFSGRRSTSAELPSVFNVLNVDAVSAVALWCVSVVAVTGVAQAAMRLGSWQALYGSAYGLLVVAKAILLAVLIAMGWVQRSAALPALARGDDRPWRVFVMLELLTMATVLGLAVALARTSAVVVDAADGHTHDAVVAPFGINAVLTQWHPHALALVLLALVVGFAADRYSRAGSGWVSWQFLSFAAGVLILVFITCSGVDIYARLLPGVLIVRIALLMFLCPALLLVGIPSAETPWRGRWLLRSSHPEIPVVAALSALLAMIATPMLPWVLQIPFGLAIADLVLIALGGWLTWTLLTCERRELWIGGVTAVLVVLLLILLFMPTVLHIEYFGWFVPPVVPDLLGDQRIGAVMAGAAVLLWAVLVTRAGRSSIHPVVGRVDDSDADAPGGRLVSPQIAGATHQDH